MRTTAMLCPAYNRPRLLGHLIAMFCAQRYPAKELVILEDSGIFGVDHIIRDDQANWRIISTDQRYPSVGAKRNALAKMTDAEILLVADDDDWYLPWHIPAAVEALSGNQYWAQPSQALEWDHPGTLGRYYVYGDPVRARFRNGVPRNFCDATDCCYGGQWSCTRKAFLQSGGYPVGIGNGDDTHWGQEMFKRFGPAADPLNRQYPDPSYVYSRDQSGSWHASELGLGTDPLKSLAKLPRATLDEFKIELPAGYFDVTIPVQVQSRKW